MKKLLLLAATLSAVGLLGGCEDDSVILPDVEDVIYSQEELEAVLNRLSVSSVVTSSFTLTTSIDEHTISWESDSSVIEINGSAAVVSKENATVKLTASVSSGHLTVYKTFTVVVENAEEYTVMFASDNDVIETQTITENDLAVSFTPVKEGYEFIGWYDNETLFDFNTPITDDVMLEAKWEINTYTVSFNVDGIITNTSINYNELVTEYTPVKEGYEFIGWYNGESEFDFTTNIKEDITLTAIFEEIQTYYVTFNYNGTSQTVMVTQSSVLTVPDLFLNNTDILAWSLDGTTSYDLSTKITSNLVLYAVLDPSTDTEVLFNNEATSDYAPIYTANDLKVLFESLNNTDNIYGFSASTNIELKANITLDSEIANNISYYNGQYKGVFDGNNYVISGLNLQYTGESTEVFFGLFRELTNQAVVQNVIFDNAYIYNSNDSTASNVGTGILAGISRGTIENIIITNSEVVTLVNSNSRAGLLVGRVAINNMDYNSCINNIIVLDSTITGGRYVGGIVGHADYTNNLTVEFLMSNCYVSNVTINGYQNVGGLVGYCRVSVSNCVVNTLSIIINGTESVNGSLIGYTQTSSVDRPTATFTNLVTYSDYTNAIGQFSDSNGGVLYSDVVSTSSVNNATFVTSITLSDYNFDTELWTVEDSKLIMLAAI